MGDRWKNRQRDGHWGQAQYLWERGVTQCRRHTIGPSQGGAHARREAMHLK